MTQTALHQAAKNHLAKTRRHYECLLGTPEQPGVLAQVEQKMHEAAAFYPEGSNERFYFQAAADRLKINREISEEAFGLFSKAAGGAELHPTRELARLRVIRGEELSSAIPDFLSEKAGPFMQGGVKFSEAHRPSNFAEMLAPAQEAADAIRFDRCVREDSFNQVILRHKPLSALPSDLKAAKASIPSEAAAPKSKALEAVPDAKAQAELPEAGIKVKPKASQGEMVHAEAPKADPPRLLADRGARKSTGNAVQDTIVKPPELSTAEPVRVVEPKARAALVEPPVAPEPPVPDVGKSGETVAERAKTLVTHPQRGWSRFWREEQWMGKKGLAVSGAVVGLGAIAYGVKSYIDAQREKGHKPQWTEQVTSSRGNMAQDISR